MVLITGGAFQGKEKFAKEHYNITKEHIVEGETAPFCEFLEAELVLHFHLWIRKEMQQKSSLDKIAGRVRELIEKNPGLIIEMNEVGSGIVPMDTFEREYRENTGRIGCMIAEASGEVWRVTCGIARRIK